MIGPIYSDLLSSLPNASGSNCGLFAPFVLRGYLLLGLDQNYLKRTSDSFGGAKSLTVGAVIAVLGTYYGGFALH